MNESKQNSFDQTWEMFFAKNKLEIFASVGLLALLGGILLAVRIFATPPTDSIVVELAPSVSPTAEVWVDIGGAVVSPGPYKLPAGSRMSDLIEAAGGFTDSADQDWIDQYLNQVQRLTDGDKIYIPPVVEGAVDGVNTESGSSKNTSARVSLNRGTLAELMTLPGIGESYAQRIMAARPFSVVSDLLNVSGIGEKRYAQIKDLVTVN